MPRNEVFVPLVTPLRPDGEVCATSVAHLVASLRHSAAGYLPCLTSGEGWKLSDAQWEAMVRHTVAAAGSHPVVAGAERATTEQVLDLAKRAQRLGARGIMLTSPFGAEVEQDRIFDHYRRVHELGGLDVYIYNESSLSKNVTSFETLVKIAELPRVVGIKDSSEEARPAEQIEALQKHGVAYYLGWEHLLGRGMPADGSVVSLANLEPALCKLACRSSDRALQDDIGRLTEVYGLIAEDGYRHVKVELCLRGVISTDQLVSA
jgi:4-hydroxy-tetrahydrodipicolinate synthase